MTSQISTAYGNSTRFDPIASRQYGNGSLMNNPYMNGDEDDGMYRMKYERTVNELDDAKRRLVNQHEEDLEQMMMMKKQMEKKINEAYEEVDENKRDSAQWKNKYKKAQVGIWVLFLSISVHTCIDRVRWMTQEYFLRNKMRKMSFWSENSEKWTQN